MMVVKEDFYNNKSVQTKQKPRASYAQLFNYLYLDNSKTLNTSVVTHANQHWVKQTFIIFFIYLFIFCLENS